MFNVIILQRISGNLMELGKSDGYQILVSSIRLQRLYFISGGNLGKEQSWLPHWTMIVVATDDTKIAECCRGLGADVIMTSESCWNGTERCNEALQKLEKK
eukprot:TRINITY_DN6310_c0_g1_i6.p1 TRINITY_DN6310_c0_g1~~TRINITY_DN6310_c0_g1_i6.p1  ORF type:complete len:101 (+),score=16.64 TRINITY_DN6310_c0_g1_i6:560-862(+)